MKFSLLRSLAHYTILQILNLQENPAFLHNNIRTVPPTAPPAAEDLEIAAAIRASIQSAMQERPPPADVQLNSEASSSVGVNTSKHGLLGAPNPNTSGNLPVHEDGPGSTLSQRDHIHDNGSVSLSSSCLNSIPSAPPIEVETPLDDPVHYPSIDLSPVDISSPAVENSPEEEKGAVVSGSSCVICLDAPAEGACIPCGHVAGCMPCLNEVKAKRWGCPVCRAKIDQVIKIYHV